MEGGEKGEEQTLAHACPHGSPFDTSHERESACACVCLSVCVCVCVSVFVREREKERRASTFLDLIRRPLSHSLSLSPPLPLPRSPQHRPVGVHADQAGQAAGAARAGQHQKVRSALASSLLSFPSAAVSLFTSLSALWLSISLSINHFDCLCVSVPPLPSPLFRRR